MSVYTKHAASEKALKTTTPQNQPIPGREAEMARNNAGGFTFTLDAWGVLDRFLMLGSESGGYYVGVQEKTASSFQNVRKCVKQDGVRAVMRAVEYSTSGRAPKNDPALVLLAIAASEGNPATVSAAYNALPQVARTGTHLFTFVSVLNSLGKWNAAAKRGVAAWYTKKSNDRLALQMLKYQSRNGWSHRDVLRLAHVKAVDEAQNNLFKYAVRGADHIEKGAAVPQLLVDFEYLKHATSAKEVVRLLEKNKDLTWEMVPTQFLKDLDVISAMLPTMGLTALIRQLGRMSAVNALEPMSENAKLVISKLSDAQALKDQRIHPLTLLQAMKQYSTGHGEKGSTTWTPNQRIVDALDDAFYASFANAEDQGVGQLLGIDCSGSMFAARVNGSPNLTAAEVAGVFALGLVKNQSNYWIGGFNHTMGELKISPNMRLDAVLKVIQRFSWGATDCSLPMRHALEYQMKDVDLFTVITDNETWCGAEQPSQALVRYRKKYNPTAKLAVIATDATPFTIADPKDAGMLDIAGFDSAAPQILAEFAKLGH